MTIQYYVENKSSHHEDCYGDWFDTLEEARRCVRCWSSLGIRSAIYKVTLDENDNEVASERISGGY